MGGYPTFIGGRIGCHIVKTDGTSAPQPQRHVPERGQGGLQVLDDFLLQHIGRWQRVKVVQAVVLKPEDIQTGLVARHQVGVAEEPEAFGSDALKAVLRVVAGDEILQVINGCGLLIADLSQCNKNVNHEVGFLMGLNQGRGEPHENFILIADSTKVQDSTIGFNLRAWQQVRFNDTLDLTRKLVDSLEQHFELKGVTQ